MVDKVTRFTDNEVVTTAVFNQRVDETNAAFAVVDEAIDGLSGTGGEIPAIREKDVQQDARLGTLETAAAAAERDIAANDARDDVQDTQIAELGATLGQHGTDITGLKTDVESHSQQIAAHVADTTVHITGAERTAWNGKATITALNAVKATADAALPKAGGAMTGTLVAAGGADYTTARVRNIVCATDTNVTINDGDVLHVYK